MRGLASAAVAAACLVPASLLFAAAPPSAHGSELPSGFQDEPVLTGLEEPTTVRFSPDGRVFVAEKAGKIWVYDDLEDASPTLFADLRTEVYDKADRGILGLALDPEFPKDPYVYILYAYDHILGEPGSAPRWGEPDHTGDECPDLKGADACLVSGRLSRLTANGNQMESEQVLIEDWCQQFSSHSIGDLQFGPEGALYASGGDGASFSATDIGQLGKPPNPCGDPPKEGGALRSLDLRTGPTLEDPVGLDGTIIRVDPDSGEGLPGNPMFSSLDPNARRIVAYGLRNPFRFAIDPTTHEIYAGNVGWDTWEEIDRFNATPGEAYNSGWPCYEGPDPQPAYEFAGVGICEDLYGTPGAASPPFFYYRHHEKLAPGDPCLDFRGSAVSGSTFYTEGPFPPPYHGAFFFADSVRGCIFTMFPGEDGRPDPATVASFMTHSDPYSGVDLEVGPDGNLYYASLFTEVEGNEFELGAIHRIEYFSGNQPPVARLSAAPQPWGESPLTVEFDAGGSTDADEDELEYEWDLDGDGQFEDAPTSASTATETYKGSENRIAAVRVVDPEEATSIDRETVYPGDTPPEPEIFNPDSDYTWRVAQLVPFEGGANDGEDGDLPSTSLDWGTRLFHCPEGSKACHAHPLQAFPAVASGSFIAPDHDYPSYIELTLTAVDSRGLAAKQSVKIDPRTVDLAISSNPLGLTLSAGLLAKATPFNLKAIKGSNVVLSAPASAQLGGVTYSWQSWSDGGSRVHTIEAESSTGYEAVYTGPPLAGPPSPGGGGARPQMRVVLRKRPSKKTHSRTVTFSFSADQADARFRCKLDKAPLAPCRSPKTYRHLKPGWHTFKVLSVDGEAVSKPIAFSWKVLKSAAG